jgi:hypothetical protein
MWRRNNFTKNEHERATLYPSGVATVGQRMVVIAALAAATMPFAVHCGHERSRCEPVRTLAPTPELPSDAETVRAVEQAGFRYERCQVRPRYRLVRSGTRALTTDEKVEVGRHLLPSTPGPSAARIGICDCEPRPKAPGEESPVCVSISLRAGDLEPPALAALISRRLESLSLGAATLTVRVDLHAKPGPRCLPDHPGCGPIPVGQRCPADIGYAPGRARKPVFERIDGGDCAHDGECDSGICGDSCYSTRELDRYIDAGSCFAITGMKPNALCGCVAGQCTFFTQTP